LLEENGQVDPDLIAGLHQVVLEGTQRLQSPDAFVLNSLNRRAGSVGSIASEAALAAIAALTKAGAGAKESVPLLSTLLENSDFRFRLNAAFAIWQIDDNPAPFQSVLDKALKDTVVRNDSVAPKLILRKLRSVPQGWAPGEAFLRGALRSPRKQTRHDAVLFLREIGTNAVFALPELRELLNDPVELIRDTAASTIKQIEREGSPLRSN